MSKNCKSILYIDGMKRFFIFGIASMMLLLSASTVSAIYMIQEFGTDNFRYLNSTNITVSGKLMNDSVGEPDVNITLRVYISGTLQESLNTTTDSTGAFSQIIPTNLTGRYSIVASAPDISLVSPEVYLLVYGEDAIQSVAASFTRGTVYPVTLNGTGYGNTSINGTQYNFFVSSGDTVSVDDGVNTVDNLMTNSRLKLGNDTYTIFFVNRTSEIVLAKMVKPVFTGSEGNRNLTLLALNARDQPLSGKYLSIIISNSSGIIEASNLTATDAYGMTTSNISISTTSGIYTIQILESDESLGTITYSVNPYDVAGDILSSEWTPQHTFARGQNATLAVSVKTNEGAILNDTQASVSANVRGPGGFSRQYTLSFDTNRSLFYYVYQIPDNAIRGTYTVEYITTISSQTLRSFGSFEVKGYSIFLKPMGNKVAELEGFFPGEEGYILVSGTDLSTGETADINLASGGSNRSNFTLSIKNSEGKDVAVPWGVMSLDSFFSTAAVEPWLQNEIRARAPNASVINLTTPGTVGIYDASVTINLNGTIEEASTSLGIQNIFLYAFPVSSDGNPAMSVSSQENVTLRIEAFNPRTMGTETNITAAGIVESFAADAGEMVTDRMLNTTLVTLPDGSKGLRFYNNDSNLGFHMVKFWANVTLGDGNTTQAIGTGFFDVKLYFIWANPATTETGNFMTFTSGSNISLRVRVMNTGFSPQEGKQVSIDEVRNGQTWEKIDFNKNLNNNWTGTTDSNGTATLSFTPTNPLKSGWYDVRIKLTTQDASGSTVTDYGRGWFEVRNFMFWAYPDSWNVKSGADIPFRVQAVNPADMSSTLNATVRVKKVMVRADWSQPPIEVSGPHTLDTGTIATNMSQSAMINYTGGKATKSGMYEFVFEATSGSAIEESSAWLEIRPFVAWVSQPGNMWNNRFGVNNTINLIVHAGDSWGGTPITLNASLTNITSVTKMGMFGGSRYKTQSELNITSVTQDTDGKAVNITLTLTDWQEGSYDMVINAVDNTGNEVVTHFWIEVEVATIGLPQFYMVGIPDGRVFTNKASFNLTDTPSEKTADSFNYPQLNYSVAPNSKAGHDITFLRDDWGGPGRQRQFWALVNLTEPRRLYVNYYNANFSDNVNTTNITVGGTFNEKNQQGSITRRWNVTSISSDGTVNLEGLNALNNGYIIDTSISKSGSFVVGDLMDSEWLKVDLDGNGQYERNWTNPDDFNNTYHIVLADNSTPGIYDTVFVSNFTSRGANFTKNGINASKGDPVTFGGKPIYLVSLKKEGENYNVAFTSYTTGFGGMWLGTFEKGKNLTVPFLVQYPGTTTGISGANVIVDKLTWYGPNSDMVLSPAASATTDANGLARITINTTNIPTGQYLISYKVTGLPGGREKTATEKWRMPGLEIRKFIVEADIGNIGTISTHLITNGSGLTVVHGTELEPKGAVSAYRITGPDNTPVFRVGWPFDMQNEYYYNASDGRYYTGFDGVAQNTTGSPTNNNSIVLTMNGANTTYNFTEFIHDGPSSNISIPSYQTMRVYNYWNITAIGNTQLQIDYLLGDQPPQTWPINAGTQIFWGPGELNIRITANDAGAVNFTLIQPKILYQVENLNVLLDNNPSNGEWESGRVTKVSYKGYDVYGYNDVYQTEIEKLGGWSPTLDYVLVANSTWNHTYRIGQRIPELGNEYVGLAAHWGGKIIFVNDSVGIYPLQDWAPDGDSYYVGTFKESDVNVDLNNNFSTADNTTYYIRLEDNNPNGVFNVTSGMFDDDTDFTQSWGISGPIDLYSPEQGSTDMMGQKFDERWITLGSMYGWPFGIPEVSYNGNFANLTTFSQRWAPFGLNDDVTMYISARSFSNQPINGNVSLDKLIVMFKYNQSDATVMPGSEPAPDKSGSGPGGAPQVYDIPGVTSPITNGIGIWRINYSVISPVVGSFDSGNFVARLNITDSDGNFETVERSFFMQNQTAFACDPSAPCSGGGGGGGGGFK